jgi:hypothetical protein
VVSCARKGSDDKILAFFGSDLARGKPHRFLTKAFKDGFALLALDSDAMASVHDANLPCRVIEDYLDPEEAYQAHVQANECRLSWFDAARQEFTIDGICWPELDTGVMRHFWSNATHALALARLFRSRGIQALRFFRHFSPLTQIGQVKSDTCGVLWEAELPGIARSLITFEQLHTSLFFSSLQRALRRFSPPSQSSGASGTQQTSFPKGGVFLVTGPNEALRFGDLLGRLSEQFPAHVGVALVEPGKFQQTEIRGKHPMPVQQGRAFPIESWIPSTILRVRSAGRTGLSRQFLRGYFKARDRSAGRPWQRVLQVLQRHFEHFCLYRWPYLHDRNLKFWSDFWDACRPRLILASTVEDTRFRIPVVAAQLHGIPTVGIPHGGVVGAPGHAIKPVTDYLLYSNEAQKVAFERSGFSRSCMLPCKGLVAANEYPVNCVEASHPEGKLRLLALTDTTDEGTNLAKLVGLRAQYRALKALMEPPSDMADHLDVRLKVHPHFHDLPMIAAVGSALATRVMPLGSDLHTALERADLVVAINYYGSALIHAYRACKPVLCFFTVQEKIVQSELNHFSLFAPGAAMARTPEEFWNTVRLFMNDSGFAQALRKRAAEFAQRAMDDSQFPEISTVLSRFVRP